MQNPWWYSGNNRWELPSLADAQLTQHFFTCSILWILIQTLQWIQAFINGKILHCPQYEDGCSFPDLWNKCFTWNTAFPINPHQQWVRNCAVLDFCAYNPAFLSWTCHGRGQGTPHSKSIWNHHTWQRWITGPREKVTTPVHGNLRTTSSKDQQGRNGPSA